MDLAEPGAAARLQAAADELGFEPDLLINCAGLGSVGVFHELPLERQLLTLQVNMAALVELTHRYVPRMVARGDGTILNVASTAALQPMPYFAVYAASKAFVLSFSEALWAELRQHGVRVVAVCPGPMSGTEFHTQAGDASHLTGVHGLLARRHLRPSDVAVSALRAAERGQPTVVVRVPIAGALYAAVERLTAIVVPRRHRLVAGERAARWLLHVE
jgi:short-subunit dehydrogenase